MSYLVLARKYRPGTFADIIGQDHIVRTLGNALALGRVHHAFLFTGARGVGKTTMARVLARALNCAQGPTLEPCGSCAACVEIAQGICPDVFEIDGASNTSVDHVRDLRDNVGYLPSRGRSKIYIIDEVHMLSQAAFNALLKTLEEPPPHVKFIFATTEAHKIPVTILSRCQRFDFRRVSMAMLLEHLRRILQREGLELGTAALAAMARQAQGSVRDALSLLDQVLSYVGNAPSDAAVLEALGLIDSQTMVDLAEAIVQRCGEAVLNIVEAVEARGHDLCDVATLLVEHWRDVMVLQVVDNPSEALLERAPGEVAALREQAQKLSRADVHRLFALTCAVAEDVSRSPYPRLSLEMGLLRLLEVEPAPNLTTLVERLDQLAGGALLAPAPVAAPVVAPGVAPGVVARRQGSDGERGGKAAAGPVAGAAAQHFGAGGRPRASGSPATGSVVAGAARPHTEVAPGASSAAPEAAGPAAIAAVVEAPQQSGGALGVTAVAAPVVAVEPLEVAQLSPQQLWRAVVERVARVKPALASMLEHGQVLRFEAGVLELGFGAGTLYGDAVREPGNRVLLQNIVERAVGRAVQLQVTAVSGTALTGALGEASLAQQRRERALERREQIEAQARAHPAVRGVVAMMGGEITAIRALGLDDSEA